MERELSHVVDALPGLVWTARPDGQIDFLNQYWVDYTGLGLDVSYGRGWQAAVLAEDLPRLLGQWQDVSPSQVPAETNVRLRAADGSYRWFRFSSRASSGESGQIAKWCGLATDVDDRVRVEEALRASERRSRLIVDGLPVLLSTSGADGELEGANRHYLEYFGASLEELQTREAPHSLHPDDRERVQAARVAAIEAGLPYEVECRRRRADGVYRWFHLRGLPLRDAAGRVAQWYRLQVDIEDQKRAEALLAGEKQLLEMVASGRPMPEILEALCALVEAVAHGCLCSIVLVDPDGAKLQQAIAPSLPTAFNDAVRGWPLDRVGGPCVTAARDKVQVIMSDVATDARWRTSWRTRAQEQGLRSCWSTPMVSQAGKVLGTFALYQREPGTPSPLQLDLIAQFTNIASIAIDRAQRDEALRESEARLAAAERELQQTIDHIPAMVASFDADGRRLYINKQVREYTGHDDAEDWGGTVHPDDVEQIEPKVRAGTARGEPFELEYRIRRADGVYRWFLRRRVPLRDETGKVIRWFGASYDIDERKHAEEALRQSGARLIAAERELRVTLDSIPTITWRAGPNGYVQQLNKRWFEYTGTTPEQVRGWRWKLCVHPDDLDRLVDIGREYVATGTSVDGEARLRRHDGAYRWFLFRPSPVRDESGTVTGWYGSITDIEDRKQAEAKVVEAERESRRMLDEIPTLIVRGGTNGYIQYLNKQWFEYTGSTIETAKGFRWQQSLHPDDRERLVEFGARFVATREPGDCEARLRRSDGTYRWFLFRPAPACDESENFIGWYGTVTDIEDRKLAEEKVAGAERGLKLIIDTIPSQAWAARLDGSVEFFNQDYIDYVGLPLERLRDWGWTAAIHPDDVEGLLSRWRTVMTSGQGGEAEARMRRHDGQYRWFMMRVSPLHDEQGAIVKWYGVNIDIEDRKRAETQLAGEKELLEMVASGRPLRDVLEGVCRFFEKSASDCYCGIYPIDWSGPVFQYGIAPSLPAFYTDQIERLPVSRDIAPCGIAACDKIQVVAEDMDSDPRWRDSSYRNHVLQHGLRAVWSTPICSLDGTVLGTFCVYQPVPGTPSHHHQSVIAHATHIASIAIEQSRAEAALRRSETFLAEGQRISLTGSFSWPVDSNAITFSQELRRIFELEPDAFVTLGRLRERTYPEDRALMDEKVSAVRAGADTPEYEIRLLMPDGRIKHVRIIGRLVRHQDGKLECLGAVQDVTQRRLAEEALDKARSELAHVTRVMSLGALTASIAHEVNQPLAGIITNASTCLRMLGADPPNIDGARETARRTIRDGNRAADVITRLRALFSKKTPVTEMVDLNEATREVLTLLFSDLLRNRVNVRVELDETCPLLVTGDRVQLQQVILNLVRNASDAMSEVGDRPRNLQIKVELDQDGHARLAVTDVGVGFAAEAAERLFDAFYTTKRGGMGIGLSLSRSIIENHGGKLWAETNDGPGATFSFSIPRQAASGGDENSIWTPPTTGANDLMRNA